MTQKYKRMIADEIEAIQFLDNKSCFDNLRDMGMDCFLVNRLNKNLPLLTFFSNNGTRYRAKEGDYIVKDGLGNFSVFVPERFFHTFEKV